MRLLLFLVSLLSITAVAEVPQVVRDTSYDWRCVREDFSTISNHQRQDKAIVACQEAADANPGDLFYIEGGRYRVQIDATEPPPPPPPPVDTDGDGVIDADDQCPDDPGPASNDGCPLPPPPPADSDGDGVIDADDRCPNEAGPASNDGCPVAPPPPPPAGALYDLYATDTYGRGQIPFAVNWPAAPNVSSTVQASCGSLNSALRSGVHVVLTGSCGGVVMPDDAWLELADGASVGGVSVYDGTQRVKISCTVPRSCSIGRVLVGSSSTDILFDGVSSGILELYDFQRLGLLNSYVSGTGNYQVAAWRGGGPTPSADLIVANTQVESQDSSSFRLQHVNRLVLVDSLGDTRQTGYASLRLEYNVQHAWIRNYTGFGGGMTLDPQVGSPRPSATVHDVTMYDSAVYHTDFISVLDTNGDISNPAKVYNITMDELLFYSGSQWTQPGSRIGGVQEHWNLGVAEYARFSSYPGWSHR